MASVNVALSIFLARQVGLAGVIWGTAISYFVCMIVPISISIWRFFSQQKAVIEETPHSLLAANSKG
jgi:hypothetical protein